MSDYEISIESDAELADAWAQVAATPSDEGLASSSVPHISVRSTGSAAPQQAFTVARAKLTAAPHADTRGRTMSEVTVSTATAWSLQRILFLLAGIFTLTGVILGVTFSPWFLVLPAMTGANQLLMVATGWCPVSLILTRFLVQPGCP